MYKRPFLPQPQARRNRKTLFPNKQDERHVNKEMALTRPKDFITRVQGPMNLRITKPPRTVLISGIPLCFA